MSVSEFLVVVHVNNSLSGHYFFLALRLTIVSLDIAKPYNYGSILSVVVSDYKSEPCGSPFVMKRVINIITVLHNDKLIFLVLIQ